MVIIQAESYDAAIKQARQEKRKAKKQQAVDKQNSEMAHVYGFAALGRIVDRLNQKSFHLWEHKPTVKQIDNKRISCRFEAENATAETTFCSFTPLRVLLNGAGFVVGVEVEDNDKPGDLPIWYAVGVYGERVVLIDIPTSIGRVLTDKLRAKAEAKT